MRSPTFAALPVLESIGRTQRSQMSTRSWNYTGGAQKPGATTLLLFLLPITVTLLARCNHTTTTVVHIY